MATQFVVTLNNAKLVGLIRDLPGRAATKVETAAGDIQARASQLAPRDTGSLQASIYVSSDKGSDYSQHASQAHSLNPLARIQSEVTPDLALTLSGGGFSGFRAVVGVAVEHGIYQEFGTRYQAPQSFMIPAVEGVREQYISDMKSVANV